MEEEEEVKERMARVVRKYIFFVCGGGGLSWLVDGFCDG